MDKIIEREFRTMGGNLVNLIFPADARWLPRVGAIERRGVDVWAPLEETLTLRSGVMSD